MATKRKTARQLSAERSAEFQIPPDSFYLRMAERASDAAVRAATQRYRAEEASGALTFFACETHRGEQNGAMPVGVRKK